MADGVFHYADAVVVINSVDLSDHVTSLTLDLSRDKLETTAMGDDWEDSIGGTFRGTVSIDFQQDFASSKVDDTLWTAFQTTSGVVSFSVKPSSATTAANNPAFSGSVFIENYSPLNGSRGELATTSVSWPTSGTVSRATS